MKQWKTISSSDYVIDDRKKREILNQFQRLAHSYTPEWQFDEKDPDIGTVLAFLFADQMQENIRRYNSTLERDYAELVNMMGISPRPAYPAHSIVLMNMVQDTIPGQKLQKGTKLLGGDGMNDSVVFETAQSIYITEARLTSMFMASGSTGKVIPLKGRFQPLNFITSDMEPGQDETLIPGVETEEVKEFTLFDFSTEGYGKTGLMMYHSHLFDEVDNDIWMDLSDSEELPEKIVNGEYSLFYYGTDGFVRIRNLRAEQGHYLVFQKSGLCKKVRIGTEWYSALLLKPEHVVEKNITVSDIRFSSSGSPVLPDYVIGNSTELSTQQFYPFGKKLSLFSELYIGHRYFANPGALITIDFDLQFEQNLSALPEAKDDESLRIIKRKPKRDAVGAVAEVYADEISLEYYNGTGWKKLPVQLPVNTIFGDDTAGHCRILFECPKDWQETETGGYDGMCIRMQLLRADNCYFQPSMHHCPLITNMKISYTYENHYERPEHLITFQGSGKWDITNQMAENDACPILLRSSYNDTSLYLGFDKKMVDGPVGLLFRLEETERETQGKLLFYYSTRDGFSRLKLTDRTDGLGHTGTIFFMPPSDMAKRTMEGQEAYWIKITDEDGYLEKNPICRPRIKEIALNAVEVDNIETMEEEEYYIDAYEPDMDFPLTATNILRVDVGVNETGNFTTAEMKKLLLEQPGRTYAEYDIRGEIRNFYVKWNEVDNFDQSESKDRHYVIDRMNSRICFGDGIHVQIPKNTSGPAFKTVVRCCDGKRANIKKNEVDDSLGNLMFVDDIHNPVQAFGGMDMETMEEALRRGTATLNSRKRLVSALDYEREVLDYSHGISQVKVITGERKDGSYDPEAISIVVLMEDYKDGRFSFINLRRRLKEHLLKRCELSVDPACLEIVEPLFVEVSVEAWIRVVSEDDSFEVQQALTEMLKNYLDPVRNNNWEIGREVVESQIELRLNMEKGSALIRRMMITCKYRDENGVHEAELSSLRGNPYTIITSGEHKIHFE